MGAASRNLVRASVALAVPLLLGACMHWEPLAPRAFAPLTLDSNQVYRFKLRSGGDTVIAHPKTVGDSIVWNTQVSAGTYWIQQPHTMPIDNIRSASVQRADVGGTIGSFFVFALALGALVGAAGGGFGGLSGGHL